MTDTTAPMYTDNGNICTSSQSVFTLPDPSSVPSVSDSSEPKRIVITSEKLKGPERQVETFGEFKKCATCNMVLNSASQAEMHYAGKLHQKRLKKMMTTVDSATSGTDQESGPSVSPAAKVVDFPHCELCGLTFTAVSQATAHLGGARHAKKLRQQQQKDTEESLEAATQTKASNSVFCNYCNIDFTSEELLNQHLQGDKHKNAVSAAQNATSDLVVPSTADGAGGFTCASCNIATNSEKQFQQHMSSARHRNKLVHIDKESSRYQPYVKREIPRGKKMKYKINPNRLPLDSEPSYKQSSWNTNQPSWNSYEPSWNTNQPSWKNKKQSWNTNQPSLNGRKPSWNINQKQQTGGDGNRGYDSANVYNGATQSTLINKRKWHRGFAGNQNPSSGMFMTTSMAGYQCETDYDNSTDVGMDYDNSMNYDRQYESDYTGNKAYPNAGSY